MISVLYFTRWSPIELTVYFPVYMPGNIARVTYRYSGCVFQACVRESIPPGVTGLYQRCSGVPARVVSPGIDPFPDYCIPVIQRKFLQWSSNSPPEVPSQPPTLPQWENTGGHGATWPLMAFLLVLQVGN